MDLDDIKRGLRAEIKRRENEQYLTFQCNVRQMCKDVLAKLEEQESEIAELKAQKAQAEDDCAFWKTRAQKTADDNLVMAKQLAEKDAEIRKLNFQMWSARCEAAEAECDAPRLARCRYMADKFKEVTK